MKTRRFPFRFSLRTALLAVLLIGAGGGLWWHWAPWSMRQLNQGQYSCRNAEFSPDSTLAFSEGPTSIKIWNVKSGACLHKIEKQEDSDRAKWDPRGKRIAAIYTSHSVQIWDAQTAVSLQEIKEPEPYYIDWVKYSPDGTRILVLSRKEPGGEERSRLIETDSGKTLTEFNDNEHFAAFSPDSKYMLLNIFIGHSSDGERAPIASRSKSGFGLWNLRTGERIWSNTKLEHHHFANLAFRADGQCLVGSEKEEIWPTELESVRTITYDCEWAVADGQPVSRRKISEVPGIYVRFSLSPKYWTETNSPDGLRKLIREGDNRISIHDGKTGAMLTRLSDVQFTASSARGSFSSNAKHILAGDYLFQNHCWLFTFRRPEQWYGLAWLPEFWATLVFALGVLWSARRDWRELKGRKAV